MPRLIPTPLPESVRNDPLRDAEQAVYEAFASHAPDDSIIFYSVSWLGRPSPGQAPVDGETDFVVAHPDNGILVIEVKGGKIKYDGATDQWYSIDGSGKEHRIDDPFDQVKKSKYALLSKIKQAPGWNRKYVRLGHCVIFPDSARPSGPISTDSAHEMMAFTRDLGWMDKWLDNAWEYWSGKDLESVEFGARGMEMVEKLLARSFQLEHPLAADIAADSKQILQLTERQFDLLGYLRRRRRVAISGGAGTGKTMLAVEKAKQLAGEGMKVLLTCFNRPLAEFLEDRAGEHEDITVRNFHWLCHDMAEKAELPEIQVQDSPSSNYFNEVLPNAFMKALEMMPEERFDAIVVDEGQDFREEWWTMLQLSMTDPEQSILYVFYDDNQRLYGHKDAIPQGLDEYPLDQNLRNTRSIYDLASRFYEGEAMEAGGPAGRPVEFIKAGGERERQKGVSRTLHRLIIDERISPASIAVLSGRSTEKSSLAEDGKIGAFQVCSGEECDEDKVAFESIRRFKGLERPVVILVELEDVLDQEDLLYVGITRANAHLVVVGSDETLDVLR
ncbi:MAG: NERD domain-containing protein [bacterium]|nr:NERD domain-containing protein [bacterium]